jgi:hypothetical protein
MESSAWNNDTYIDKVSPLEHIPPIYRTDSTSSRTGYVEFSPLSRKVILSQTFNSHSSAPSPWRLHNLEKAGISLPLAAHRSTFTNMVRTLDPRGSVN